MGTGAVHLFLPDPLPLHLFSLLHTHFQSSPVAIGGKKKSEFPASEYGACFLQP